MENCGKMEVKVFCAKDLAEPKKFSFKGPSAVQVMIEVGGATQKTSVAEQAQNPVWNELLEFTGLPTSSPTVEVKLKTSSGSEMGAGSLDLSSLSFYKGVPYEDWVQLRDNDGKKVGLVHVRMASDTVGSEVPQPPEGLKEFPLNAVVALQHMAAPFLNKELAKVVEYVSEEEMSVLVLNPDFVKNRRTEILKRRPRHTNVTKWTVRSSNLKLLWDGKALPEAGVYVTITGLMKNPEQNGTGCQIARISTSHPHCRRVYIRTTPEGPEEGPYLPANLKVVILQVGSTIEIAGLSGSSERSALNGKHARLVAFQEVAGEIVYNVELPGGELHWIYPRNAAFISLPDASPAPSPRAAPAAAPVVVAPALEQPESTLIDGQEIHVCT
ncbi:hypothetical protein DIPPA_02294 [Diplonema papillatum]|nr:hypothetical protein DIPPA_02294 [Diplonema papillatum]